MAGPTTLSFFASQVSQRLAPGWVGTVLHVFPILLEKPQGAHELELHRTHQLNHYAHIYPPP